MNTASNRLMKEARALFVPWVAILLACALPLLWRLDFLNRVSLLYLIARLGLYVGVPLLATLSFGFEFQHKTLALLLSQPVERKTIWREKLTVSALAVMAVSLVAYFAWPNSIPSDMDGRLFVVGAAFLWLLMTWCSAMFWTLLARSTLGGLILNIGTQFLLFALVFVSDVSDTRTVAIVMLVYSAVMLWLGWIMLNRYQAVGGFAGPDLMTAAPNMMPSRIAGIFRNDPKQRFLNLIRKELRLLRPLWFMTALFVVLWTILANWISHTITGRWPLTTWQGNHRFFLVFFSVVFPWIAMILAGSVSISEERESGVHAWHLTLPLSSRTQWAVKFLLGLGAGALCAIVIPTALVSLSRGALGPDFAIELERAAVPHLNAVLLIIFVLSFWSASAMRGMTRAVLLFAATGGMLTLASEIGVWIGHELVAYFLRLFLFTVSMFQLNPFNLDRLLFYAFNFGSAFLHGNGYQTVSMWGLIPALLLAIGQSYSLYRRLPQSGIRKVAWRLLPILVLAFALSAAIEFQWTATFNGGFRLFLPIEEAVEQLPAVLTVDASHSLHLTSEQLAPALGGSPDTARWLRNSNITIALAVPQRDYNVLGIVPPNKSVRAYLVTIRLPNGLICTDLAGGRSETYFYIGNRKCE